MSGPLRDVDLALTEAAAGHGAPGLDAVEVREGRCTTVGGLAVVRVLPTKGRRTVGPWCFVDLLGPMDLDDPDPLEVGPHPHVGLSTVTWLTDGEALHTDSLGTEQVIRAGQLNLMTAGHGISHAELAARPPFHGAQLWLAQPEATRHGASAFAHHADLPRVALDGPDGRSRATVLLGALEGNDGIVRSPARTDWPTLGAELTLAPGTTTVALDPSFEYAVTPLDVPVRIGSAIVEPGSLALVPVGADELPLTVRGQGGRALIVGGLPLGEPIAMWWNFVARDRAELTAAWHDWNARTDRFGTVASPLRRIEAPAPPWVTGA